MTPPVSLNGSPETSCYGAFPADADFETTLDTGSLLEQVLLKLPRDEETDETRPAPIAAKVVDDDAPGPVAPIPRLPKLDDAEDEALKLYDAPHIFSAPPSVRAPASPTLRPSLAPVRDENSYFTSSENHVTNNLF